MEPDRPVAVSVVPNGPLRVTDGLAIEHQDGSALESGNRMTLCRCGAFGNKPFCDGSHEKVGFSG